MHSNSADPVWVIVPRVCFNQKVFPSLSSLPLCPRLQGRCRQRFAARAQPAGRGGRSDARRAPTEYRSAIAGCSPRNPSTIGIQSKEHITVRWHLSQRLRSPGGMARGPRARWQPGGTTPVQLPWIIICDCQAQPPLGPLFPQNRRCPRLYRLLCTLHCCNIAHRCNNVMASFCAPCRPHGVRGAQGSSAV